MTIGLSIFVIVILVVFILVGIIMNSIQDGPEYTGMRMVISMFLCLCSVLLTKVITHAISLVP